MKKVILLALVSIATLGSLQAQIDKGDWLVGVGIGSGYSYAGGVPLVVNAEYAFSDKLSVGPYFAYVSWRHRYAGVKVNYSFLDFGVRVSYHFNEVFNINVDELDVYGGGFLGARTSNYNYNGVGYEDNYDGGVSWGIHAGARYYFKENIAGFAEVGHGISALAVGLTFKL